MDIERREDYHFGDENKKLSVLFSSFDALMGLGDDLQLLLGDDRDLRSAFGQGKLLIKKLLADQSAGDVDTWRALNADLSDRMDTVRRRSTDLSSAREREFS